ncbi:hypothetical protein GGI12_000427 [Dipsacomyces acuminosporus]|nr:hypothetical protein GGI12_000427 [Dipsacomyces acuminosporus]
MDNCAEYHTPDDMCVDVVRRAVALESEERDRYWRTNADIWHMEDMLEQFSHRADTAVDRPLATGGENIALMPELTTALPPANLPGGETLLCDPAFDVNASMAEPADAAMPAPIGRAKDSLAASKPNDKPGSAAAGKQSTAAVAHAVPVGVDELELELDMAFVPLAQIGATTLSTHRS